MNPLPSTWFSTELKKVCTLLNGRAYKQFELLDHGKYPVLRVGNFFSNRKWYFSDLELDDSKYCDHGDLLYAWSASFGPKIWDGGKVIFHYHIWRMDVNPSLLDKTFLFYWLSWDKEEIKAAHGTGSTMIHVTKGDMEERRISLPPLAEQRRIVAKVDALCARTARAGFELSRVPVLIDLYKQRLLALALSGELTASWREANGLPEPIEVELSDVAKGFSYGSSAKSATTGEVPVLRMGNIQDGKLDWNNLVFTSDKTEIAKYTLVSGDVLFNRTNSPELVGKTALYRGEQKAIYAGYLIRIQCTKRLLPEFLTYCLNGPAGREYCWRVKTDGVSQSNINAKKIAAFRFVLPDHAEQVEIVRRIDLAFSWLQRVASDYTSAAQLLSKLDGSILAKAFRGELIPQDPNDEPASVMLARVGAEPNEARNRGRGRPVKNIELAGRMSGGMSGDAGADAIAVVLKDSLMSKSRHDADVMGQPYLAQILRKQPGAGSVDALFKAANLPVADFYKQLAWEIENHHIRDQQDKLEAA